MAKNDRYWPTQEWFDALWNKVAEYKIAKATRNYTTADALREELISAGVSALDMNPSWHPVSESVESRSKRLEHL